MHNKPETSIINNIHKLEDMLQYSIHQCPKCQYLYPTTITKQITILKTITTLISKPILDLIENPAIARKLGEESHNMIKSALKPKS